jgi:Signal peptide peptidase
MCRWLQEPTDISLTLPEVVSSLVALCFCGAYVASKHWFLSNALGLAFSIQGIEHFSLGATQTGIILLSGLFFYDIFWVFCTPVMVRSPCRFSVYEGMRREFNMSYLSVCVVWLSLV